MNRDVALLTARVTAEPQLIIRFSLASNSPLLLERNIKIRLHAERCRLFLSDSRRSPFRKAGPGRDPNQPPFPCEYSTASEDN